MTPKTRRIKLSAGFVALVDSDMYPSLRKHSWYTLHGKSKGRKRYAMRHYSRRVGGGSIMMHRVIANTPAELETHHINGDTLDNRRANLRIINRSDHIHTRHKRRGPTSSCFKGVSFRKDRGRYVARISRGRRPIHIGFFGDEVAAALAYDARARQIYGPLAQTNFHTVVAPMRAERMIRNFRKGVIRVIFRKRGDGSVRRMLARVPSESEPSRARQAILVHELPYPRWRLIPFEGILAFKIDGVFYAVKR